MTSWRHLPAACREIMAEHVRRDEIPTSVRFLFYELVQREIIPKSLPGKRQPQQYVSDALMELRESGEIPWSWIVDETRSVLRWAKSDSVLGFLRDSITSARISPWGDDSPPLVLVESRSLAGVLRSTSRDYLVQLASTNGQVGGFLHTDIGPALVAKQRVIYLGDLDHSGRQIEQNTRTVLEQYADLDWERLALTDVQVHGIPSVIKHDKRYRPARAYEAWETEALGQNVIVGMVRDRLDELLPEPLSSVRVRQRQQRERLSEYLDGYEQWEADHE